MPSLFCSILGLLVFNCVSVVQSWHNIAHKHLITRGGSEGSIFNYHK